MTRISKSKYCLAWQCPKLLWLDKNKPESKTEDSSLNSHYESGQDVGNLAKGLLGDYIDVTTYISDNTLDYSTMLQKTKECLSNNVINICEASFAIDNLFCSVDILHKENDGYAIYEVKSSTQMSQIYIADIAFQKYVLEQCGINVTGTYLIYINNNYTREDDLDIHQLFNIADVSKEVIKEIQHVPTILNNARDTYNSADEPSLDIGTHCRDPYNCPYWDYCTRNIGKPSVFDLYRIQFKKALEYYKSGCISYNDLINNPKITNVKQLRQIEYYLSNLGTHVDKDGIRAFLDTLSYPIYFLDFETTQDVIPLYPGTKPYQQIPFQYSLHYIEKEGGPLLHKEFLAVSGTDPRRDIAERLCKDIPMNVCVTAYNKSFECTRLKELAETFPDLAIHLLNIRDNIKDLLEPFQGGYYYNKTMGGSFSIKSVLPAIFPNDPALDYHNLEQIHNGSEAMTIFPRIKDMTPEEQKFARQNLLKYCELDTYAMVKVWEELINASK